jgi:hypothetical protein
MADPNARPEVIVDFVFENGLLFLAVENIGDRPALKVVTTFDHKIMGVGGGQEITAIALFKNIEFMAPRKRIATLVDASSAYFQRGEPVRVAVTVAYSDGAGHRYTETIHHDLSIYGDIVYVNKKEGR